MNYVIGCGGVGSWLIPKLAKLTRDIVLVDGDKLEKKNLDRQLFDEGHIGMNKAEALFKKYLSPNGRFVPEFFHSGSEFARDIRLCDTLWCCADNSTARREALLVCDDKLCQCIIGANEYTDAEAYIYLHGMRNTPNDPRVFYPSILTDHTGDPLAPEGCTGEAAVASPQLVLANDWASGMMLQLYWFYQEVRTEMTGDTRDFWPVMHRVNKFKFSTIKHGERKP